MENCCQMHCSTVENRLVELKNKAEVGWLYLTRLELIRMKIWLNFWMESRMAKEHKEQIQRGMERFHFARGRTENDDWALGIEQIFYLDRTPVRNARRCDLFPLGPSPLDKLQKYNNGRA